VIVKLQILEKWLGFSFACNITFFAARMIVESTENILGSKLQLYYNVCGSLS
jgi:hypothetical protein